METIETNERRLILQALDIAGPALIRGDAATPQELTDLRDALADEQVRLIMRPGERLFSVPMRISVLATDAEEAGRMVQRLVEESACNIDFEKFTAFEAGPATAG